MLGYSIQMMYQPLKGEILAGWGYNVTKAISSSSSDLVTRPLTIYSGKTIDFCASMINVFYIDGSGRLFGRGYNYNYNLGLGDNDPREGFARIGEDTDWAYCSSISFSDIDKDKRNYAIKKDGTLYTWGVDFSGAMGLGNPRYRSTFTLVDTLSFPSMLSASYDGLSYAIQDKSVYLWGRDFTTSPTWVGNDTLHPSPTPYLLEFDNVDNIDIKDRASSFDKSIALINGGSLYTWGSNAYGELGQGYTGGRTENPEQVGSDQDWKRAKYSNHLLAIKNDGSLFACGNNNRGQLGLGDNVQRDSLERVDGDSWDFALPVRDSSFGIKNGELYGFGLFDSGLGVGSTTSTYIFRKSNRTGQKVFTSSSSGSFYDYALFVLTGTSLQVTGEAEFGLGIGTNKGTNVTIPGDWSQVSTSIGNNLSVAALTTDKKLFTWGWNLSGQLGQGDSTSRDTPTQVGTGSNWEDVSMGQAHGIAVDSIGNIFSWGGNSSGQLGLGDVTSRNSPTQIVSLSNIVKVSAGALHSAAIDSSGRLYTWGNDQFGRLGRGVGSGFSNVPVQIGTDTDWEDVAACFDFTYAIKGGKLYAWGRSIYGQTGQGQIVENYNSPVQIGTDTDWVAISKGFQTATAIKSNGDLYTWGYNTSGATGLGLEGNVTAPVLAAKGVTDVTSSQGSSFLVSGGAVYSTGYNFDSGVFLGVDPVASYTPLKVGQFHSVSKITSSPVLLGGSFSSALVDGGKLWTVGGNTYGQLGHGDFTHTSFFRQVGTDTDWEDVSSSGSHMLGLKSDGTVYAWGWNLYGQLGLNDLVDRNIPVQVPGISTAVKVLACSGYSLIQLSSGEVYAAGRNSAGNLGIGSQITYTTPTRIGTETGWKKVVGFYDLTLALNENGTLYACGNTMDYADEQWSSTTLTPISDRNDLVDVVIGVEAGSFNTNIIYGLTANKKIYQLSFSSSTLIEVEDNFSSLHCGQDHYGAMTESGDVYTWGSNEGGQLGLGDTLYREFPTKVPTGLWKDLTMGQSSTLLISQEGELFGCGDNFNAVLTLDYPVEGSSVPIQIGEVPTWDRVKISYQVSVATSTAPLPPPPPPPPAPVGTFTVSAETTAGGTGYNGTALLGPPFGSIDPDNVSGVPIVATLIDGSNLLYLLLEGIFEKGAFDTIDVEGIGVLTSSEASVFTTLGDLSAWIWSVPPDVWTGGNDYTITLSKEEVP